MKNAYKVKYCDSYERVVIASSFDEVSRKFLKSLPIMTDIRESDIQEVSLLAQDVIE